MTSLAEKRLWEDVVQKLLRRTQANQATWSIATAQVSRNNVVGPIYETHEQGKTIICYKFRYEYFLDDDQCEWREDIAIEFIDSQGETAWRFPEVLSRFALVDAIQYQLSDAKDFAERYLLD